MKNHQQRQHLENSDFRLVDGPNENREIVLINKFTDDVELWVADNDFQGHVIELNDIGYKFVSDYIKVMA